MCVQSLGQEDPLEKEWQPTPVVLTWKNPMDRAAWQSIVHGAAKTVGHDLVAKQQQLRKQE